MSDYPARWIYFFANGQADGGSDIKHLVGGKGASLADMTKAGLNVPPGFTISAECCELYYKNDRRWPAGLEEHVRTAMQRLEEITGRRFGQGDNSVLVAVRSGAAQSMPGMMDTELNVGASAAPWQQLFAAITAVFESWNSERAVAYRQHHKVEGLLGTAVNVQVMCPAEVAGVMFTANPVKPALRQVIIESAYGLGEAIVLGKVTPDRFALDKDSLAIQERSIAKKGENASLNDNQLLQLARLGLRIEDYFKTPCDIEWALSRGEFYLLQSRPIRVRDTANQLDAEREKVRQEEIEALRAKAAPDGTVWSRFNLSEILPEPTPMTWAIVKRFMSGKGGYGLMYRDLGFDPDPALDEEGVYDLICGRPYCNLSREPSMQYRSLPFEHRFETLKANPSKAMYPQATLNPAKAGWRFWLFLPIVFFKLWRGSARLQRTTRTFAGTFVGEIVPSFLKDVEQAAAEDWSRLSNEQLAEKLEYWIQRTLYDFARESLKPTALAGIAMGNLERVLARKLQPPGTKVKEGEPTGLQKAQAVLRELVMGVKPARGTDLAQGLRDLADGKLSRDAFLRDFGHRGSQEMELAKPRWAEDTVAVERLAQQQPSTAHGANLSAKEILDRLVAETKMPPAHRAAIEGELQTLQSYLGLRETAKHYLLRGYALIRRALVELDRRFHLSGDIFFLVPEDLPRLFKSKEQLTALIAERKKRRELALGLPVPQVLFSDDLEAIGREAEVVSQESLQGVPLSAGTAEGPAWVLHEAIPQQPPTDGYILVCPSTDPAWVPLFVKAKGLVMETGGVLSHGAIVAREFGLPAVAGIPDVHRRLRTGQRLRVDGGTGKVNVLAE